MQQADPHHPILHIGQPTHLGQQPVAVHMATAEAKRRPALNGGHQLLAAHALDHKADHRDPERLVGRCGANNSNPAMGRQKLQKDLLQPLFMLRHLGPAGGRGGAKILHDAGKTLSELVICGGKVKLQIQAVGGLEEVAQRLDLVMDTGRGIQLCQVWPVHLVPREGLQGSAG